jgi:hypothetical protein
VGKRKIFKLGVLLLLISLPSSFVMAACFESIVYPLDNLLRVSSNIGPAETLLEINQRSIKLTPYKHMYTDEASFHEYLDKLENRLASFEGYMGITGINLPPRGLSMYYKESGEVTFRKIHDEQLGTFDFDHSIQTSDIIVVDHTLIKMDLIPGLDEAIFGKEYMLTEEIPVLVGGKEAKYARVGEVYPTVLSPRTEANVIDIVEEKIVNCKVVGIVDMLLPLEGMVFSTTPKEIVIMPKVVNADGTSCGDFMPSEVTIVFKQPLYNQLEELAEVLKEFGNINWLASREFISLIVSQSHTVRNNAVQILMALISLIFLLLMLFYLVTGLAHRYLPGALPKIAAVAAFSGLCYVLTGKMIDTNFIPSVLYQVLSHSPLYNLLTDLDMVILHEVSPGLIYRVLLITILLLALALIASILFRSKEKEYN